MLQDKAGIAKPIEVKQRQKGQALGFGVRHRDDEWEEERAKGAGQSVSGCWCGSRRGWGGGICLLGISVKQGDGVGVVP